MNRRKLFAAAATAVLGILLAAGAQKEYVQTDHVQVADGKANSTVTLDWYVNYSWFTTDWGTNAVSRAITDQTGVSVNFVTPSGNEAEKLNALIAAEDLPDVITIGWWEPQVGTMIEKGLVYPLNELADAYAPEFWDVADPMAVSWYTQSDGNIYGYPNSSVTPKTLQEHKDILQVIFLWITVSRWTKKSVKADTFA